MRVLPLAALLVLICASSTHAQATCPVSTTPSGAPVCVQVEVYNQGATSPLQIQGTYLLSAATANQAPSSVTPTTLVVNPSSIDIPDFNNPGKVITLPATTAGLLASAPISSIQNYVVTVRYIDDAGRLGGRSVFSNPFRELPGAQVPGAPVVR